MSRELSKEQKNIIEQEVRENIRKDIDNPYTITIDTYFKCMELLDSEDYQNVGNYLGDLKEENFKKTYMSKEFEYYQIDKGN